MGLSHIMMKRFTSDGLIYAYKRYKVIKLCWHVSLYNSCTNQHVRTYLLLYN